MDDLRVDHTRYRKRSPENSKAGAQAYEATVRQRLARGVPIDGTQRPIPVPLFRDFVWTWFNDYVLTNNKFAEQRAKRSVLNNHLIPFFGRSPVGSITTHQVEQFKARQVRSGASPSALRNRLTILSKCLNCAHEWLDLATQPPRIRLPKVPPPRTDYLSGDECEALLAAAEGVIYEMILTTLRTGMRQGEIKGLQWPSIDWQNRSLIVQHSQCDVRKILDTPKNGRARHIPLEALQASRTHRGRRLQSTQRPVRCRTIRGREMAVAPS